jgi:hypothetical protein
MTTTNSDPVQDYILESPDKFRIAWEVSEAWPKVRRRAVLDFLGRLQSALQGKTELKGWEFALWGAPFVNSEAGFSFGRPTWGDNYYADLYFGDFGQDVFFGLARDKHAPTIEGRPPSEDLLAAVKERYSDAGHDSWWEAWVSVPSLTGDWSKPEVLWRMQDEKDPFLNEVAKHLLKVATICEPFVEQLVAKKRR